MIGWRQGNLIQLKPSQVLMQPCLMFSYLAQVILIFSRSLRENLESIILQQFIIVMNLAFPFKLCAWKTVVSRRSVSGGLIDLLKSSFLLIIESVRSLSKRCFWSKVTHLEEMAKVARSMFSHFAVGTSGVLVTLSTHLMMAKVFSGGKHLSLISILFMGNLAFTSASPSAFSSTDLTDAMSVNTSAVSNATSRTYPKFHVFTGEDTNPNVHGRPIGMGEIGYPITGEFLAHTYVWFDRGYIPITMKKELFSEKGILERGSTCIVLQRMDYSCIALINHSKLFNGLFLIASPRCGGKPCSRKSSPKINMPSSYRCCSNPDFTVEITKKMVVCEGKEVSVSVPPSQRNYKVKYHSYDICFQSKCYISHSVGYAGVVISFRTDGTGRWKVISNDGDIQEGFVEKLVGKDVSIIMETWGSVKFTATCNENSHEQTLMFTKKRVLHGWCWMVGIWD